MISKSSHTVIFDGVCNLCNRAVNYIIRHDPERLLRFTALQSTAGQQLLEQYREGEFNGDTIILLKNGTVYERSDAVLEILSELPGCRYTYRLLKIMPQALRDRLYDLIARNRYRLFGRRDTCMVPTEEIRSRFLG